MSFPTFGLHTLSQTPPEPLHGFSGVQKPFPIPILLPRHLIIYPLTVESLIAFEKSQKKSRPYLHSHLGLPAADVTPRKPDAPQKGGTDGRERAVEATGSFPQCLASGPLPKPRSRREAGKGWSEGNC